MRFSLLAVAASLAAVSAPAVASGPGVHIREAKRTHELLAMEVPGWGLIDDEPLAMSYLAFGAISPDFDQASDTLTFGYSLELSWHLLEKAQFMDTRYRMFALGHLCHLASDPAGETFVAPTLIATQPLGMFNLVDGNEGPEGETEGLYESFGDLVLGDWMAVVDLLFDFWLDGDAAKARAQEMLLWYCESGNELFGKTVDCDKVYAEIAGKLATAEDVLGGMDRQAAKDLVATMLSQPLPDIADLVASGMLSQWLGEVATESPNAEAELARVKQTALMDPAYWQQYDLMADVGPSFAVDIIQQSLKSVWLGWDWKKLASGNIESVMQAMPDDYAVVPGLLFDKLDWLDTQGAFVSAVTPEMVGQMLLASIRFYSALPLTTTVTVLVKKDMPGLDQSLDQVVGQASADLDIDPKAYAHMPRSELTVPFVADAEGALGFYVEVLTAASPKPCFTSSWDRLWGNGQLPMAEPMYQENFGTYGHWPPSLPVAEPETTSTVGNVFVAARVAPAGPGLPAAQVSLTGQGKTQTQTAADNGIAMFEVDETGTWTATAALAGYAQAIVMGEGPVPLAEPLWLSAPLHAIPQPVVPEQYWWNIGKPIPVTVDPTPFGFQAAQFRAQAVKVAGGEPVSPEFAAGAGKEIAVYVDTATPDATVVRVRVIAQYKDGTGGVQGESAELSVDGSPPEVTSQPPEPSCELLPDQALPYLPGVVIKGSAADPHTPLAHVEYKLGTGGWTDAGVTFPDTVVADSQAFSFHLDPSADVEHDKVQVRVTNAAGLATETEVTRPVEDKPWCAEDDVITQEVEAEPDVVADVGGEGEAAAADAGDVAVEETGTGGSGGGCALVALPHTVRSAGLAGLALLLSLVLGAARRRARSPRYFFGSQVGYFIGLPSSHGEGMVASSLQ